MQISNAPINLKPSHQNALELFHNDWLSRMPEGSGLNGGEAATINNFTDTRVPWGSQTLGGLAGKSILELGPFEAYNTYQFETMGATRVLSLENNPVNFLKCLVIKNIFNLSASFMLGDFLQYFDNSTQRFDVCWASGVLYHMTEPIRLLQAMANVSDSIFIWTQYYDKDIIENSEINKKYFVESNDKFETVGGRLIRLHQRSYIDGRPDLFSGGNESYSYWMEYSDIKYVLSTLGFTRIIMGIDNPDFQAGPACFFMALRDK